MSRASSPATWPNSDTRAKRLIAQLAGAALLGLVVVYGVGFSHIMPVHNAAHDVRHTAVFPCH